jgi:hypothetical protein
VQDIDLGTLWVEYAGACGSHEGSVRDTCTEDAAFIFELWGFSRTEARVLASLYLKPKSFECLQWDVGFDAGDAEQAERVRAVLHGLALRGILVLGDCWGLAPTWTTIFFVLDPTNMTQIHRFLSVTTAKETLARCTIANAPQPDHHNAIEAVPSYLDNGVRDCRPYAIPSSLRDGSTELDPI